MRADRLLSILLLLQMHSRLTARHLAKRLEVSERTILRDMEALGAAGVPVTADRGVGGGWRLMEGYKTNVSGLTDAEVQALFVNRPSRLLEDLRLDRASDGALVKLLSVLPAVSRRGAEMARQRIHIDVSGWSRSREPVPQLPALQQAVWSDRRLRILYDRGEGCASERLLDPLGLVAKGSVWYLVAAIDGEIRSYRVSRIREVVILDESFARPPDFDLAAFWERSAESFRERLPRFAVVIRARADAVSWIQSMTRFGAVDQVDDDDRPGWKRIAMHFDAAEVARATLLGFGTTAEVLEPESLHAAIVAEARAVTRCAGGGEAMLGSSPIIAFVGTKNAERTRAFYETTLGLSFVADEPYALVFDANGVMVRIFKIETFTPASYTVLGWRVTDIHSTIRELGARGVNFERYPRLEQDESGVWVSPSGAKVAWFKDPDGNTLSLTEFAG